MADFNVDDKVVYSPHGAGTVVSKEERDGVEYLSIRIQHSKMTLMVPSATAAEKGVRPIVSARTVDKLLKEIGGEGAELAENRQQRERETAARHRTGDARELASILRDYTSRQREGKKLSMPEQRSFDAAKLVLASEIALAKDIDIDAATERLDTALGIESD